MVPPPATSFARGTLLACSRWPEAVRRGRFEASLNLTRRPQRPACSGLIQTVRTAGPPEATSSCQCTCLHSQISQNLTGRVTISRKNATQLCQPVAAAVRSRLAPGGQCLKSVGAEHGRPNTGKSLCRNVTVNSGASHFIRIQVFQREDSVYK